MFVTNAKIPIVSAVFGLAGMVLVFFTEMLIRRYDSRWLTPPIESIELDDAQTLQVPTIGPQDFLATYNESAIITLQIISALFAIFAIFTATKDRKNADRGYGTAIGLVSGGIALAWGAKLLVYGV